MKLKTKVLHGVFWVALTVALIRLFNFVTKIVLAIILEPEAFGLIAIAILAISALDLFRDLGIGAALIYKKDDSEYRTANSAFLILPIVATFLFALAYVSAPYVALFFNKEEVEPIVRVFALTIPLTSIGTVPSMLLEKELEFKKKVIPEAIPSGIYAVTAISLAYSGFGVWSLVYGRIALAASSNILFWIVSDWRPTFKFDPEAAKGLFRYGKHVLGASVLIFLMTNVDNAVIGRLLGMEELGLYAIAFTIATMPATQIIHLTGRVMFPAYSKLQNNMEALGSAYLKTSRYISMLAIPVSLGIFIIAPEFVSVILGEKWIAAVPALRVLCILGMVRSIAATFGPIFQATGNPRILRDISLLELVLILILVFPFTKEYGIFGTALAMTIPSMLTFSLQIWKVARIIDLKIFSILRVISFNLINTIIMILSITYFKTFFPVISIIHLVIMISAGFMVYCIITLLQDKELFNKVKTTILSL